MVFLPQPVSLPVRNVMPVLGEKPPDVEGRHGPLLPDSVRALLISPSGCGKTLTTFTLLTMPNGLKFEHIYLYAKTVDQPLYTFLRAVCEGGGAGVSLHVYTDHDSVVSPEEAKPNSVFVFDDVATERQDCIRTYFAAGRHKHHDVLYLCQTYTKVPKQLVRDNANLIIAFRQDDTNLDHIYREHVGTDFPSFAAFKVMCEEVWREPFSFLVIDKTRPVDKGRYRAGFDRFFVASPV